MKNILTNHLYWISGLILFLTIYFPTLADSPNDVYYVQLIRGTSTPTPPAKDSQLIGPKLTSQFKHIFKSTYFWQITLKSVELKPGECTQLRLNADRSVQIDLSKPNCRIVTAYYKNKMACKKNDSLNSPITIIGGDRDADTVWFIIVRRDKPSAN